MKKIKNLMGIAICLFLVTSTSFAQESQEQFNERTKEMQKVEAKIAVYTAKHINEIPIKELNQFNKSLINHEQDAAGHNHDLTESDKAKLLADFKKQYLRIQYFEEFPEASSSFASMVLAGSCANGDFEGGTFANYSAETSNNYRIGDCNLLVTPLPPLTTALSFTSTSMTGPMYGITNVGNDPNVTTASLPMVWNGNHSARINNSASFASNHNFRGEKLIKRVVLDQVDERIYFNYALVMNDPGTSHDNAKPTFIARVLDAMGNESDRVCSSAYSSDPFLIPGGNVGGAIVYKSWVCDNIQAVGAVGDTVTLEFIMVDCGHGGHGGYAYIDDICDTCSSVPDSCNFQGSIQLNPTDTCVGETMQVCGTYNLAALNCTTAIADEIRLYIYQNGVQVGGVVATNSSPSGGTFCFTVDPADFPVGATGGFDFYAEIDFDLGALGTTIQNDYHSNPGQNNDYVFNAQCCPQFDIFTCCDLIPTASKSSTSSNFPVMNPRFQAKINAYKAEVKLRYPVKSAIIGDPCCEFCEFPDVAFPISIYGEGGLLISDVDFNISWSNDPLNNTAIGSAFPDSMVVVTVTGPGTCIWSDTFLLKCCVNPGLTGFCCDTIDFNVDIDSLCSFDPCKYPSVSFPIRVLNNNSVLTTTGYSFQWSTGSNSSAISVTQAQLPVWVIVTDLTTGCVDSGFYDINCAPACTPLVPTGLGCSVIRGGQSLSWNPVAGATYEVAISWNDPKCCNSGLRGFSEIIQTANPFHIVNSLSGCFSWKVRSVCPDGTVSGWSSTSCSCLPIIALCKAVVPANLNCLGSAFGQTLTWDNIIGRTYEVEITYGAYDPLYKCCKPLGLNTLPTLVSTTTNSLFMNTTKCFTWRVRSICSDGTVSKWSSSKCSCYKAVVISPNGGITKIGTNQNSSNDKINVTVSPNPASEISVFDVKTTGTNQELGMVYISSLTGELVYTSEVKLNGKSVFDLSELKAGTYIYKVTSEDSIKSGRIVIVD